MRNLLIFLTLFFVSTSSFSSQTLYYYKKTSGTVMCANDYSTICSTYESDARSALASNHVLKDFTCSLNASFSIVSSWKKYYTTGQYFGAQNNASIGSRQTLVCGDDQEIKLTGCTAECVTQDPCKQKKDQIINLGAACGTFSCPSGSVTTLYGGQILCSNAPGVFISKTVNPSAVKDNCGLQAQALPDQFTMHDATGRNSEVGQQTQDAYCSVEYKYTGTKVLAPDTIPKEGELPFTSSSVPPKSDGSCPDGYKRGYKGTGSNMSLTCVPDSGCVSGQSKVNGVCTGKEDQKPCSNGAKRVAGICPSNAGGAGGGGSSPQGAGGDNGTACPNNAAKVNGVCPPPSSGNGTGSGSASASCEQAPDCNGDPLVCANLNQIWVSTCKQTEALTAITEKDVKDTDESVKVANEALDELKKDKEADAFSLFADFKSDASASGNSGQACIPNMSLSVMGQSMTIPFFQACDFFKFLRLILIATAYFAASRIVFTSLS